MTRYRVRHRTTYRYTGPVDLGQHQVFLRPRDTPGQTTHRFDLRIDPAPEAIDAHTDDFGNHGARFTLDRPHQALIVDAHSEVSVHPAPTPMLSVSPAWEDVAEYARRDRSPDGLTALAMAFDSRLTARRPALAEYARQSFTERRPVLEAADELNRRIFAEFAYDPTATTVSTPVDRVFAQRRGVCQDFAHVMIAMLRSLGLPARYVSGYLRSAAPTAESDPQATLPDTPANPNDALVGADASHAWVSLRAAALGADLGWVDFDPTNNRIPGDTHVTVAWGRDYADVAPVKGVIVGGGAHHLDVAVRVEPAGIMNDGY
ncbi:MAG: transglutaminase family protein [Planctomycetota bacterium]